jgi:hypothetical protein
MASSPKSPGAARGQLKMYSFHSGAMPGSKQGQAKEHFVLGTMQCFLLSQTTGPHDIL